jgi:Uma2 family endonuclease
MDQIQESKLSLEEYNRLEDERNQRYEYHDGEVFAMAGGDPKHGAIASNLIRLLGNALLGKGCRVFNSDVKVYIIALNKSLYPDLSVVCGLVERSDKDARAVSNPTLLVEVLSESTRNYDSREKFMYYSQIPTLKEYVLVEQDQPLVQVFFRGDSGKKWQMEWFSGVKSTVKLQSVEVAIPVGDIYADTKF